MDLDQDFLEMDKVVFESIQNSRYGCPSVLRRLVHRMNENPHQFPNSILVINGEQEYAHTLGSFCATRKELSSGSDLITYRRKDHLSGIEVIRLQGIQDEQSPRLRIKFNGDISLGSIRFANHVAAAHGCYFYCWRKSKSAQTHVRAIWKHDTTKFWALVDPKDSIICTPV